jgi:hypothetical protein
VKRWLWSCLLAAPLTAQVEFEKQVLPLLQQKCFECHRESRDAEGNLKKPKGGLRLDGRAWIEKGGKGGRVLAPGNAAQSELYTRTVLPPDHDDKMPARGEPLTAEESDVLKRWIDGGASFGAWVGETGPAATAAAVEIPTPGPEHEPTRHQPLVELAQGLAPASKAACKAAAGDKARITPVATGSPLLRVEFTGHEDEVTDADVQALGPLAGHIAILGLGRTKIGDLGCAAIGKMPRLVQLDLRETRVTDAGIARLAGLAELRALNLFATPVSDRAVAALGRLARLESVQLWQSEVSDAGLAELQRLLPGARVTGAPELPPPAPASDRPRRPRR